MKTFKKSQCLDDFSLFPAGSRRVAITSFPGSGNTWARHLLHMGTGIWTGNARSSEKLKEVGWQGEDIPCKEGRTIAIKTHKWHTVKKCAYQAAIILVRNPFHALVAEFNRQMTGKTEHLDAELFAALGWNEFVIEYSRDYFNFFDEWFTKFHNPITVICFEEMVKN